MFGFSRKKKAPDSSGQKDQPVPVPSSGIKGSLISLEQRLMFDAAAAATASEVATEQVAQEQAEAAVSGEASHDSTDGEKGGGEDVVQALTNYMPAEKCVEVAFVDPTVPNYQELLAGMDTNIEVIMLDGGQDGVEQMAAALSGRSGIDAIHLISHGSSGELQLGTGTLNTASMSSEYADEFSTIRGALSDQADLLVYGCSFGEGAEGADAVNLLAELTGADVAASSDQTGHIDLGGDWEFEVHAGSIETDLALTDTAQMNWAGILGTETVADTFSDKSYGNNDGTSSWSSNWAEVDRGASDADGGHIKVNSGELRIETQVAGASVSRGVDLSGANSAKFSFDYNNDLDKGGSVEVRISSDGGANYRILSDGIFSKASHIGSGTASFDISDHMSVNTKIQFVVTGTSGGDRLFIDNVQVNYHVADANAAPTDLSLSANSVAENATTGTVVGTITDTDVDTGDTKNYSLTDTAGGRFAINASTGVITVADGSLLNYEAATSHSLTVQVTDSGNQSYTESFTINLTNVNEGPIITSNGGGAAAAVNMAENQNTVTMVAAMDVDPGTTLTYGIAGGPDAARFSIDSATGALRFSTAPNFERRSDVGRNNVYDVTVQVSDGHGGTATQSISVRVTDVNEAPRITSNRGGDVASVTIRENGSAVTTVRATDPDRGARITYSVVGGTDAALFTINPSSGVLRFSSAPNFEQPTDTDRNNVYQVVVQASDGRGGTDSQAISIRVTNVNEAPTDLTLSAHRVAENATTGTVVGTIIGSDPDSRDTKTYSLTDTAGGRFAINRNTGVITVADGTLLNYESAQNHNITVQVMDKGGLTYRETFAINLTNVNETPTDLTLSANSIAEHATTGTVVGTVSGTDPDARETKTYSLTDTAGGRFAIDSATGQLTVADGSLLSYDSATSHTVAVRVTDSEGQSYTEIFTINVANVNEASLEDVDHRLTTANFGIHDINVSSPASLSGIRPSSEPEEDRPHLPDNPRRVIEVTTAGPLPIEILKTGPSVVSAPVEKAIAAHETERLPNLGEKREPDTIRDLTDIQNTATAEADRKEFLEPDDPIENVEESMALKLSATMGLAGVVLQNSLGNGAKLRSLISRPAGASNASPEMMPQQSSVDDHTSNQNGSEHSRSTAEDADQAGP